MFCRVGAKMGPRSMFFGQVGDLGGHLGAKMAPRIFPRRVQSGGDGWDLDGPGSAGGRAVAVGEGGRDKSLPGLTLIL